MNVVTESILLVDFDRRVVLAVLEVNKFSTQAFNFDVTDVFMP
jgi:hypothetical protein